MKARRPGCCPTGGISVTISICCLHFGQAGTNVFEPEHSRPLGLGSSQPFNERGRAWFPPNVQRDTYRDIAGRTMNPGAARLRAGGACHRFATAPEILLGSAATFTTVC